MRFNVIVEGAAKSVGNTGSQITKTRIFPSRCSLSSFSNAEAPCKHTVQVGESITITRTESADSLKDFFSESMLGFIQANQRLLANWRRTAEIEVVNDEQ